MVFFIVVRIAAIFEKLFLIPLFPFLQIFLKLSDF